MRIFHAVCLFVMFYLGATCTLNGQIQSAITDEDSVHFLKLANGVNAVLRSIPLQPNTEITMSFAAGSMFENDTMNGVAYVLQRYIANEVNSYLASSTGAFSTQNTLFESYSNTERSGFKLSVQSANINPALQLLIRQVLTPSIDEKRLARLIDTIVEQRILDSLTPRKIFDNKILRCLYRTEFESLSGIGSAAELKKIELTDVIRFHKKYYVPNNMILLATGSFSYLSMRTHVETLFDPLIRSPFDPEFITKVTDFKPMLYTTQFITEDSSIVPEFQINWQFPGTSSNRQLSYCATLLTTILNDKNNFIQVKAAKLGYKKLLFEYDAFNYSGVFRVTIQPDTADFFDVYKLVMKELLRLEKTLVNESMMNVGKLQFRKYYELLKKTKQFPEQIVKHWVYKDDSYYRELADSVLTVQEKRLRNFVIESINQNSHVAGLIISKQDRDKYQVDSTFADVDESVGNYTFHYLQNVTDVEGPENQAMQKNLLQWLLVNKDVNVQVNGYSDKGEFNKTRDPEVIQFMDSIPTFRKTRSDLIEKGYLHPETMRALKIVKYLYEGGIAADRLSGTAMRFSSDSEQEAIDNAKCTVTLNKLHRTMPLREYYYGKQKE